MNPLPFPFPTDPTQFLLWAVTPPAAGIIFALLFERAAWFQALTARGKHYLVLVFFILLPVIATLALVALGVTPIPADLRQVVLMLFGLMLQGLMAWASSQYAHGADPLPEHARNLLTHKTG